MAPIQPINVRTINGLDLDGLKVQKEDGKRLVGKPYVLDAECDNVFDNTISTLTDQVD